MVGLSVSCQPLEQPIVVILYAIKDMTTCFSYWVIVYCVVQLCLFVFLFFWVGRNGEILVLQVWSRSFADWHYYITIVISTYLKGFWCPIQWSSSSGIGCL